MKHKNKLQLLPNAGPVEFVAIYILKPLQKVPSSNQHLDILTSRYSKVTHAVPTANITAVHLLPVLLDHSVLWYSIPVYTLNNNAPQLVREISMTKSGNITAHSSSDCIIMFKKSKKLGNICSASNILFNMQTHRVSEHHHSMQPYHENQNLDQHLPDLRTLPVAYWEMWQHDIWEICSSCRLSQWRSQFRADSLQPSDIITMNFTRCCNMVWYSNQATTVHNRKLAPMCYDIASCGGVCHFILFTLL